MDKRIIIVQLPSCHRRSSYFALLLIDDPTARAPEHQLDLQPKKQAASLLPHTDNPISFTYREHSPTPRPPRPAQSAHPPRAPLGGRAGRDGRERQAIQSDVELGELFNS